MLNKHLRDREIQRTFLAVGFAVTFLLVALLFAAIKLQS